MNKADKKGNRIGRLDNNTTGYYRRVADTLSEGFADSEQKGVFLQNVFSQLCQEAVAVSRNQTVSRTVESLLQEATQDQLASFMLQFSKDWETAVTDRFASHVTQTLLTCSKRYLYDSQDTGTDQTFFIDRTTVTDSAHPSMKMMFLDLYSYLMTNLSAHMQHTYTSHILRVVLEVLADTTVSEHIVKSKMAIHKPRPNQTVREESKKKQHTDFLEQLKEMTNKIINLQKFKDHAKNHLSNPVIQTVLLVLKSVDKKLVKKACKTIIGNTDMFERQDNKLPDMMTNDIGSRLVEQVLAVASDKLYSHILVNHLSGLLQDMALHSSANFVLQRLIYSCRNKEQCEVLVEELAKHMEDMLAHNHTGVVVALAHAVLTHHTRQNHFIKALMKVFHCYKPEERQLKLVPLLATLTTYDILYKINSDSSDEEEEEKKPTPLKVSLQGSLLLQKLLCFSEPHKLSSSLLDLPASQLTSLACHQCGSHIIDAFLTSPTIGVKARAALIKAFKGHYMQLGTDKHGSRTLETMWGAAGLTQRSLIAEELCKHENKLRSDSYGRFIHKNFSLQHFSSRPDEWKNMQTSNIKKRKLFQDVIDAEHGVSSKTGSQETGDDSGCETNEEGHSPKKRRK